MNERLLYPFSRKVSFAASSLIFWGIGQVVKIISAFLLIFIPGGFCIGHCPPPPFWVSLFGVAVLVLVTVIWLYGFILAILALTRDQRRLFGIFGLVLNGFWLLMLAFLFISSFLPSAPYVPPPKEFSIVNVTTSKIEGNETNYYFIENNSRLAKHIFLQNKVSSSKDVRLSLDDKIRLEELAKDANIFATKFPCRECFPGPGYYHIAVAPKEGGRFEFACPIESTEPDAVSCQSFSVNFINALEDIIRR